MAPPKHLKDYLKKQLHLPHLYWGKKVAKECYPDDWQTGSQLVQLQKYHPAQGEDHESLGFMADDDDDYKIVLQSLKTYWSEKRFEGTRNMCSSFPVTCLLSLCCFDRAFGFCKLSEQQADTGSVQEAKTEQKTSSKRKKGSHIAYLPLFLTHHACAQLNAI
jgi:hypothetical protein